MFTECLCKKKSKSQRSFLPLWSVHVCAVLLCIHWPLRCLAWNNGKLLTQASLLNDASRLDHCDVISSLAPRAEQRLALQTKRHPRQLIGTKHKPCVTYGLKAWILNPAGQLMSLIWYHPGNCSYSSTTMLKRFPATRLTRRHVQWELYRTNFIEKIANLRVSCCNGNNDRSAWVLFVLDPPEHGEWLRQKPSLRSGVDCIIRPASSGAVRTTPSKPLNNWWSLISKVHENMPRNALCIA